MAKFNQGNLVLSSSQKIIQGNNTLIAADGTASLDTLVLSENLDVEGIAYLAGSLSVDGATNLNSLVVDDLAELTNGVDVTGTADLDTVSVSVSLESASILLASGVTIVEFSTDGTLAGDSDEVVPTEKAVKTYVDAQTGVSIHNNLTGIQGGDSTTSEYYHLTQSIHDSLYSASPLIGLGSQTGTNFEVDYGNNSVDAAVNGANVLNLSGDTQRLGDSTGASIMISQDEGPLVYDENLLSPVAIFDSTGITLYHDGVSVLATTSTGIDANINTENTTVTGRLVIPTEEPTTLVDGAIWIT